ncbi:hypothetical protein EUGRSUZ_I01658 [Eucalyptus grandis]|uniref:Uncharacterized protein n=2 Tax=Eucalyptus grandis TaxID=71139 RepID=A0ACC3JIN8_EUCGR|nr:hypothetical protein EUGRSUZ_I01658 [Eucalyptus grandis]
MQHAQIKKSWRRMSQHSRVRLHGEKPAIRVRFGCSQDMVSPCIARRAKKLIKRPNFAHISSVHFQFRSLVRDNRRAQTDRTSANQHRNGKAAKIQISET